MRDPRFLTGARLLSEVLRYIIMLRRCFLLRRYAGRFVNNKFGAGSGRTWLNYVRCRGTESDIDLCPHSSVRSCGHSQDVSISCCCQGERIFFSSMRTKARSTYAFIIGHCPISVARRLSGYGAGIGGATDIKMVRQKAPRRVPKARQWRSPPQPTRGLEECRKLPLRV